jgi:hypothetical protein
MAKRKISRFSRRIEDPCSKLQGIFDRKECGLFYDSLSYPAASGGECARFRGSTDLLIGLPLPLGEGDENVIGDCRNLSQRLIDLKTLSA